LGTPEASSTAELEHAEAAHKSILDLVALFELETVHLADEKKNVGERVGAKLVGLIVSPLPANSDFLLDGLTDEPVDGHGDLIVCDFWLMALFKRRTLARGPLIAFAVAEALRRDVASPLFPRRIFQRRVEKLLEFCGKIRLLFCA
jgi:hypothetical protein